MQQRMVELQSLCSRVTSGGTPLRSVPEYFDGGTIPWIKTGEVKQGFIHNAAEYITELGLENSSAKLIPENSLIVAMYGDGDTAGNVAVNRIPVTTNQACCNFVVDEKKAHYLFLYYYLKANYQNLVNLKLGGSQQNLNAATLKRFPVPAIEPAVQQKIAALLHTYDDLIANNQRRIALLESMAEEIYREWFVRMRFSGFASSTFEKGLPAGWNSVPLGNLIGETKRPVKKGDLASHSRYVGLEHISRKSVALTMHGSPESVDSDKLAFMSGDILFSKIRPYLHKVALAHFDGICSTDTLVLKPKRAEYREFALFTVFSETFIEIANTASKGTKMPRADWHFLKQLRISVPSDALLKRFSAMAKPMLDEITKLIQVNESLMTQRDALLPRLISGKLRVDALDIQFPPSMQSPPEEAARATSIKQGLIHSGA